ncbi:protein translocase subunit secA [Bogoriella caseilytica]|uniref:Protein translocase subunit SecA n=1 Tax=Bogoriella caseilytica TaxID=56055 RepID=A0A3N2BEQ5_9MICO|nr:preprotein translocase subunit SecA [Bogoriella caseilytica]ROR73746.1 protein translocase subunit secA [Bogoriella caseilytica]
MSILSKILRMGEGRVLKKLTAIADQVDQLEETVADLTDEELREQTDILKGRHADGESLDDLLPEAFAVVREAASRTLGQRHYRVQVMGGAALHLGNIAEMKTGEGKTLVATLPAYLNALTGKGVHVVTVNDYLASYQSELMGRVFRFLGMSTGTVLNGQKPAERREQYAADITYGTNNEFGFDYLRDNMASAMEDLVQRGHHFAIVDEVDSILIDEARTPLIISGPAQGDQNKWYPEFAKLVLRMERDVDYEVDEKKRTVGVLEAGIEKVEDHLGIDNLYESLNTPLIGFLNNAIKVKELYRRDKDYIVKNGEVLIVDEHTGRVLSGRRYSEGLHQAIEAKEGVAIKAENQTLATVTLQNYFRLYDKLGGMTGTAETEAAEFQNTYKMGVVPIPTNKPMARVDQSDVIYKGVSQKFNAIVEDIAERHAAGQPVLVGTTSVEKSETLSKLLRKKGVPHEVLNAKQHEREAAIVAMAGRKGAVTVATNMAGRGTDIMLGGNAEHLAIAEMRERGFDPVEAPEEYEAHWDGVLEKAQQAVAAEHEEVVELGGLYVLGTERHESRRIDNQLRGRSGRQGDPGESRFYLSFEDDLMRVFNSGMAARVMDSAPDDTPLEFKVVSRTIANAQAQIEARNQESRKNVLKYDDVLNKQRLTVYAERRRVLEGADISETFQRFGREVVTGLVSSYATGAPEEWDLDALWRDLEDTYPVSVTIEDLVEEAGSVTRLSVEMLERELTSDVKVAFESREEELSPEVMRQLERRVLLSVVDRKWRDHLYEMDYLKNGIGLRAMAQRDPLVEYQREGYELFKAMSGAIKEDAVQRLFKVELKKQTAESADGPQVTAASAAATAVAAGAAQAGAGGAAEAGTGEGAQSPAKKERTPEEIDALLGLEAPVKPTKLSYSASASGGDDEAGGAAGGNREQRRAAAKAAKKNR